MHVFHRLMICVLIGGITVSTGCSNIAEWRRNGFKVGPNYVRPSASLNEDWVAADEEKQGFDRQRDVNQQWWRIFNDPILDNLIEQAYQNNLDVKSAVYRVVQANQLKLVTAGNLFPQSQTATTSFARQQTSNSLIVIPGIERITNTWTRNLELAWELDFWGKIRRSIIAADANLDSSIESLDAVLVTLVADVASTYMDLRGVDKRLKYAEENVKIQVKTLTTNQTKKRLGDISSLDVEQATSNLRQTEATIPELQSIRRQLQNRLSVLVGMPPTNLDQFLGQMSLPTPPETVVVGIPADLLRRRPDIRSAERQLAAQSEQIGISTADLYPTFSLSGSLGLSAREFSDLFNTTSLAGVFSPSVQWNILNYGRILNKIRAEGAKYLELVAIYQKSVLTAQQETEDSMASFIYSRRQYEKLTLAAEAAEKAVKVGEKRWRAGEIAYNQIFTLETNQVQVQDRLVQAELEMVQSLIRLYKSLGGGWEIRDMFESLPSVDYVEDLDGYERKSLAPVGN